MIHSVNVSTNLKKLFSSKRVQVQMDGKYDMWRGNISFDDSLKVEAVTALVGTNGQLYSIGAHSIVQSVLRYNTQIGRYSTVGERVEIKDFLIPDISRFSLSGFTHYEDEGPAVYMENWGDFRRQPLRQNDQAVTIGNDVWIGNDVLLKNGIKIGDGAFIQERSLVLEDVPAYTVVAGNPARVLDLRFPQAVVTQLLNLCWWNYQYQSFENVHGDARIENFIAEFLNLKLQGKLKLIEPNSLTAEDILRSSIVPD